MHVFKAGGDLQDAKLAIFGDASLAPGPSRSRVGVVVKFGGAYRTQRQSLTVYSAFGAEVHAKNVWAQSCTGKILLA